MADYPCPHFRCPNSSVWRALIITSRLICSRYATGLKDSTVFYSILQLQLTSGLHLISEIFAEQSRKAENIGVLKIVTDEPMRRHMLSKVEAKYFAFSFC